MGRKIVCWKVDSGEILQIYEGHLAVYVNHCALTPSDSGLFSCTPYDDSGTIKLWDIIGAQVEKVFHTSRKTEIRHVNYNFLFFFVCRGREIFLYPLFAPLLLGKTHHITTKIGIYFVIF